MDKLLLLPQLSQTLLRFQLPHLAHLAQQFLVQGTMQVPSQALGQGTSLERVALGHQNMQRVRNFIGPAV